MTNEQVEAIIKVIKHKKEITKAVQNICKLLLSCRTTN